MKKLSLLLSIFLIISVINVNAFAINNSEDLSDTITFDDYSSAIKQEFEKYGIDWYGEPIDPSFIYTKELLAKELEKVDSIGESYIASKDNYCNSVELTKASDSTSTILHGTNSSDFGLKSVMYHTYSMYDDTFLELTDIPILPKNCTIRTSVDILTELLTYGIVNAGEPTLEVRDGTGIDDYVKLLSYNYTVTNNNTSNARVTYSITCQLKESMTIGGTTSWGKFEHTYSVKFYPFK